MFARLWDIEMQKLQVAIDYWWVFVIMLVVFGIIAIFFIEGE